jgi:hypothetical protein
VVSVPADAASTGSAVDWIDRTPKPMPSPPTWPPVARAESAAYDPVRRRMVMFGGGNGSTTWEWDGASGTWESKNTQDAPSGRNNPGLVYDSDRQRIVLFGGYGGSGGMNDLWEYDGTNWTPRPPTTAAPPKRGGPGIAYDTARRKIVIFSGLGGATLRDTWEWDGATATWADRTPPGDASPSARPYLAMAYDSDRKKAILCGGVAGMPTQDIWEWDGTAGTWTDRTLAGTKPAARYFNGLAYHGGRHRLVLFGGYPGFPIETWEWEGQSGTWQDVSPAHHPSARADFAMAYDSVRGKVFLFGGANTELFDTYGDVWEY